MMMLAQAATQAATQTPAEEGMPAGMALLLFLVLIAVWVGLHMYARRNEAGAKPAMMGVRILVGIGAFFLGLGVLESVFDLVTTWPLWIVCVTGAAGTEMIIALYQLERSTVDRTPGLTLVALRVTLLTLVLFMVTQPIIRYDNHRRVDRFIAILVDDSASMQYVDSNPSPSELLQLARLFELPLPNTPPSVVPLADTADAIQAQVATTLQAVRLHQHQGPESFKSASDTFETANKGLSVEWPKQLADAGQSIEGLLNGSLKFGAPARAHLAQIQATVAKQLPARIQDTQAALAAVSGGPTEQNTEALARQLRALAGELERLESDLRLVPNAVDRAYFASLGEAERTKLQTAAARTRRQIAGQVLSRKNDGKTLAEQLAEEDYRLLVYRFASQPEPVAIDAPTDEPDAKAQVSPHRQATDLAAALEQAQKDVLDGNLAGVLILSDGRHNTPEPVQPIARKLGLRNTPVCSVVIGSTRPPADAAIVDVITPVSVFKEDLVAMNVALKLDGFRGQRVVAKLFYNDEQVDARTLTVPSDSYRPSVLLAHRPKDIGLHKYRIELQGDDGKPLASANPLLDKNDAYFQEVSVTDERTKLLIVDSRPRWEFRYLRNLFAGRDLSVHVQYMLLNPDKIQGVPPRKRKPISASEDYDKGNFEATDFPETKEEWFKFDVILLGDLSPEVLDEELQETLKEFVAKRGGTLIVIAGPQSMPHRFADAPLSELLPVEFEGRKGTIYNGPEPGYTMGLTPEGRKHIIMQQNNDPLLSEAVWQQQQPFDWRFPITQAKAGASVLAYAQPLSEQQLRAIRMGRKPAQGASGDQAERKQFEQTLKARKYALVIEQKYEAGKILMLTFDQTWRLRYRSGDTYHHKFWGQVLRWGTSQKLRAGTPLVRLGTDKVRYQGAQNVIAKAQLLDEKRNPIDTDDVSVEVYDAAGEKVGVHRLAYVENSNGRYAGNLGPMPVAGGYTLKLVGAEVEKQLSLAADKKGEEAPQVQTEFLVAAAPRTSELVELDADRDLPTQLARLSKGRVVEPAMAASLIDTFAKPATEKVERVVLTVWDSWPLILLIIGVVSAEWIIRKKVGLT